jgi:DNA-binding IclR family transcriptional regulator
MGSRHTAGELASVPAGLPPSGTQSIRRAVEVLREIATYNHNGVRLVDIAEHLRLERSTAHRILQCLVYEGLLAERNPGNRYVLGPLAFELGLAAGNRFNLADQLQPTMVAVAQETQDVIFLSVRSGLSTTCISRFEGTYPIKAYTRSVGDRRPLGFGCVGTIILAALPDNEVHSILKKNDKALRTFGGTDSKQAFKKVQEARIAGYAMHERATHGLSAIAAGVYAPTGNLIAVISICALTSRMQKDRLPLLVECLKRHCAAAAIADLVD